MLKECEPDMSFFGKKVGEYLAFSRTGMILIVLMGLPFVLDPVRRGRAVRPSESGLPAAAPRRLGRVVGKLIP